VRTCNPTPRCLTGADRLAFSDEPYRALVGATMSSCGKALGCAAAQATFLEMLNECVATGHVTRPMTDRAHHSPRHARRRDRQLIERREICHPNGVPQPCEGIRKGLSALTNMAISTNLNRTEGMR
jgi:hypothetical protein